MNVLNQHRLYEYKPHVFSPDEKKWLATVGWASIPADELVERASVILSDKPDEIERVTYLTRGLLDERLFPERRRAYAFAQRYVVLKDAGTDFRLLVWDWE